MNNLNLLKEKINPEVSKVLDKLLRVLLNLNFSKDEAEKQIVDLGKLISASILTRLSDNNPEILDMNEEGIQEFIKSKYSDEDLNKVFQEESDKIILDYFKVITEDIEDIKKQKFYKEILGIFE